MISTPEGRDHSSMEIHSLSHSHRNIAVVPCGDTAGGLGLPCAMKYAEDDDREGSLEGSLDCLDFKSSQQQQPTNAAASGKDDAVQKEKDKDEQLLSRLEGSLEIDDGDVKDDLKSSLQESFSRFEDSWGGGMLMELPSDVMTKSKPRRSSLPTVCDANSDAESDETPKARGRNEKKKGGGLSFRLGKGRKNRRGSTSSLDVSRHSCISFASSCRSTSSAYAGPTPLGPDGKPLRSCMKGSSASAQGVDLDDDDGSLSSHDSDPPAAYSQQPSKMKRSISFCSVDVREYERALGDHPGVSSGVPLTLGWKYNQSTGVSVDAFEAEKDAPLKDANGEVQEGENSRRTQAELLIPKDVRAWLLKEHAGCTEGELRRAEKSIREAKASRLKAKATPAHVMKLEAKKEKIAKNVKRFFKGTNKEAEEDALWEKAHQEAVKKHLSSEGDALRLGAGHADDDDDEGESFLPPITIAVPNNA